MIFMVVSGRFCRYFGYNRVPRRSARLERFAQLGAQLEKGADASQARPRDDETTTYP